MIAQTFLKQRAEARINEKSEPNLLDFATPFISAAVPQVRDSETRIAFIMFADLSGFCAFQSSYEKASHIEPWPEKGPLPVDAEIFQLGPENITQDIMDRMDPHWSLIDLNSHPSLHTVFEATALQLVDPPEGLLDYIVDTQEDWSWQDPETADDAMTLLAQAAWVIADGPNAIEIHSASAKGQSHAQKRVEELYRTLAETYSASWPGEEENRGGIAYARFAENHPAGAPNALRSFVTAHPLSRLLVALSQEILRQYGQPEGWQTNYNDGLEHRCSGYSADARIQLHDSGKLSAHEIVEAHKVIGEFIQARGLKPRLSEIIKREQLHDHSFAALVRNLD